MFLILPIGIVGNDKIELAFGVFSSLIALACVGKGKENGKMYFPGANRPSTLCDTFSSPEWRGLPIDLSHNINSDDRNGKYPSEVAAETTFPFNWKLSVGR